MISASNLSRRSGSREVPNRVKSQEQVPRVKRPMEKFGLSAFQKTEDYTEKVLAETISFKNLQNTNTSEKSTGTMEQLYRGEKARNQLLQKQVKDLRMEVEAYRSDIKSIEQLKKENADYQALILKYEK